MAVVAPAAAAAAAEWKNGIYQHQKNANEMSWNTNKYIFHALTIKSSIISFSARANLRFACCARAFGRLLNSAAILSAKALYSSCILLLWEIAFNAWAAKSLNEPESGSDSDGDDRDDTGVVCRLLLVPRLRRCPDVEGNGLTASPKSVRTDSSVTADSCKMHENKMKNENL